MSKSTSVTNSNESTHSKLLPILLFVVSIAALLPLGLKKSLRDHAALKATLATKGALQELETKQQYALDRLREYSLQQADSEKGEKGDKEKQLQEAETQELEARKLAEQERERQVSLPKSTPWTSDVPVVMQVVVSLVLLSATLFVVLSKKYDAKDKHWAYATVGVIVGFWLKT
jgi:C4-dicarboxylate-specific signal transduction histidine kinase